MSRSCYRKSWMTCVKIQPLASLRFACRMLVGGTHSQATAKLVKHSDQIFSAQIVEEENPIILYNNWTLAKARGVFCSASRPQHPNIKESTILKGESSSERSEHISFNIRYRRGVKGETPCGSKLELPVGTEQGCRPPISHNQFSARILYVEIRILKLQFEVW